MSTMQFFLVAFSVILSTVVNSEVLQTEVNAPKPIRDRFRLIISNINDEKVEEEINDFTSYRCEKMVVIRNKAESEFQLTCKSFHDSPKTVIIKQGNAFVFSFRPQKDGNTRFWCTIEYKQHVARFDVYNENSPNMCPREIEEVYKYTVTHEGVFFDGKKDSEGHKIHALAKGHNKYILWEEYENEETDGFLIDALVDGGMCDDLPEPFNDKPAAVTICYNHCIHLYEHIGCTGKMQTVQASEDCVDIPLNDELKNKLSSVKGC